jgi:hypothetical protein
MVKSYSIHVPHSILAHYGELRKAHFSCRISLKNRVTSKPKNKINGIDPSDGLVGLRSFVVHMT